MIILKNVGYSKFVLSEIIIKYMRDSIRKHVCKSRDCSDRYLRRHPEKRDDIKTQDE